MVDFEALKQLILDEFDCSTFNLTYDAPCSYDNKELECGSYTASVTMNIDVVGHISSDPTEQVMPNFRVTLEWIRDEDSNNVSLDLNDWQELEADLTHKANS